MCRTGALQPGTDVFLVAVERCVDTEFSVQEEKTAMSNIKALLEHHHTLVTSLDISPSERKVHPELSSLVAQMESAIEQLNQMRWDVREECRAAQAEEVQVLYEIFLPNERHVCNGVQPTLVRVQVSLEDISCQVELGFMLPSLYPRRQPPQLTCYIPPPFGGGPDNALALSLCELLQVKSASSQLIKNK